LLRRQTQWPAPVADDKSLALGTEVSKVATGVVGVSSPAGSPAPQIASAATQGTPSAGVLPGAQIIPALIRVAHAADGHQITLRLTPAELGQVDIRIDRAADGTATVRVLVERPETLKLLQADQPQLNQVLDKAGLPQEGRSLTLSLSLPDAGFGASPGGSGSNHAGGQSGGARHERDGAQAAAQSGSARAGNPSSTPSWQRAGIDITA
jgi:flagellar hook-length control protein FliK